MDFGKRLLLPRIDHVQYSVTLLDDKAGVPQGDSVARALEPQGTSVTVLFSTPTTGTLHMDVSQC